MKHLYIIFLALLACCPEVIHAENEISYLAVNLSVYRRFQTGSSEIGFDITADDENSYNHGVREPQ